MSWTSILPQLVHPKSDAAIKTLFKLLQKQIMPQKEDVICFFVYKSFMLSSLIFNMFIFLFMSQTKLNQYDFQDFNLSLYIAPSIIWFFLHISIIDFYEKLWHKQTFTKIALVVCTGLLIYEFAFCLINHGFILKGYYAWLICHSFCIAGNITYLLNIQRIKRIFKFG